MLLCKVSEILPLSCKGICLKQTGLLSRGAKELSRSNRSPNHLNPGCGTVAKSPAARQPSLARMISFATSGQFMAQVCSASTFSAATPRQDATR